jgi:hypothetical protein
MRIATGKVVDGKVVVDGEPLAEGATVAVVSADENETFDISDDDAAELLAAIAEADRGDGIDGDAFLDELSRR